MEEARAASNKSFGLRGPMSSTSTSSSTADLESGQKPNRNLANLSALVKDRTTEEEKKN